MDPFVLTVYDSPFPKVRLGKDYDGGYIIADIPNINYTTLLAGGIDTDISFEEDFVRKYPTMNEVGVFDKLNKNHYLIHFHGNNCCGVRNHRGVLIPNVFECTYVHKKFFTTEPKLNKDLIPGVLDMKNTPHPEIHINYPPFVN